MIGKRENEETARKTGSMAADAQRKRSKKLLTINERNNKKKKIPDYCIIYIFGERCDNRILSIEKKKQRNKKAEKPIKERGKRKDVRANHTCLATRASEKAGKKKMREIERGRESVRWRENYSNC